MLVYNLLSVSKNLRLKVKTRVREDVPVNSITDIYPNANWYERGSLGLVWYKIFRSSRFRRILQIMILRGIP